jgi:clan AA aspartic protease
MIVGSIDANLEARIPLFVEDMTGQMHPVDAVIDTGFSGFLSLLPTQIAAFGLLWLYDQQVVLADGSIQVVDVYAASVIWNNQLRTLHVNAVNLSPLVGMKLLEGNEVRMKVVPGGLVHIDVVP